MILYLAKAFAEMAGTHSEVSGPGKQQRESGIFRKREDEMNRMDENRVKTIYGHR